LESLIYASFVVCFTAGFFATGFFSSFGFEVSSFSFEVSAFVF
jgi:hypothetical protein